MIRWLQTDKLLPPHRVTHPDKLRKLIKDFEEFGWYGPSLVGYYITLYDNDHPAGPQAYQMIQLLNGSHRYAAAEWIGIRVPVFLVSEREVHDSWGNVAAWQNLMQYGDAMVAGFCD